MGSPSLVCVAERLKLLEWFLMRIHARLNFRAGLSSLHALVRALCRLPDGLGATRHSQGEDKVGQTIDDIEQYLASLKGSTLLRGSGVLYNISAPMRRSDRPIICSCHFKDPPPSLVRVFVERMAAIDALFGYACTWEELQHRNWVFAEVDGGRGGTSEGFEGRDISKYVPGLYWLTLLPMTLAERHEVPLAQVSAVALEHADLGGGQHLFRFHDHPENWAKRIDAIDDLCARLSGVFDIQEVRRLVAKGVKSFAELHDLLRPWP